MILRKKMYRKKEKGPMIESNRKVTFKMLAMDKDLTTKSENEELETD